MNQAQKIKLISQTYEQQHNLDSYGYPLPPDSRRRLRKTTLRTSKSILNIFIYLIMSLIGGLFWLGRLGKKYPPLTTQNVHPRRILVIRLDLIGGGARALHRAIAAATRHPCRIPFRTRTCRRETGAPIR